MILVVLVKSQFVVPAHGVAPDNGGGLVSITVVANIAAFLLWPREASWDDRQSIHGIIKSTSSFEWASRIRVNVSFGKRHLLIPDGTGRTINGQDPEGFSSSEADRVCLSHSRGSPCGARRRIPPVMVGIVLLATATFLPADVAFLLSVSSCQSLHW